MSACRIGCERHQAWQSGLRSFSNFGDSRDGIAADETWRLPINNWQSATPAIIASIGGADKCDRLMYRRHICRKHMCGKHVRR
jgi:hypothetical protein